ncbi:AI-2E family transporter [Lysobacter sp. TY2-98]|uniref:AI-2E family transporter n=1 Tax=Lysobacter sp. TY2-98 TaxID=2290922 RepID=UPI0013B45904|nr:AI-2E family transporter [Lysobacter sp. TY2-98]
MDTDESTLRRIVREDLLETLVSLGLILVLVYLCGRVFMPFASLLTLGMILAIALFPMFDWLAQRVFRGKRGLIATLLVLVTLVLVGVPLLMLAGAVATQLGGFHDALEAGTLGLEPPNPKVAEWPIVGERIYAGWSAAANDLPAFLAKNKQLVLKAAGKAVSIAAGGAGAALLFLAAIAVAGVMMCFAETLRRGSERILIRLTDPLHGPRLLTLIVATVRSVATGVVGVAFIQALLLGVGFILAGIPGAGVLALLVMFLGILQLPALLISLPVVGYLWWMGEGSTVIKVVFTVYFIVAGMADNVLKPLLLGRGVEAPMLIILIGALGGMATAGITGLFLGAVLLAVFYRIFQDWVDSGETRPAAGPPPASAISTDTTTA